jgi:hypothetical protein
MPLLSRAFVLLSAPVAVALAAEPFSPTALSRENVFAGPAAAAGPQAAANETIEFAGISTMGQKTELIFFDKTTKKNHWIEKGETKEGITVLNYDPKREEAVVKINGNQKTLMLRQGAKSTAPGRGGPAPVAPMPVGFNVAPATPPPTAVPMPLPAPVTPAAVAPPPVAPPPANKPETPNTPEAVAKAETEARMLVSDLLEIGMAQRKAYEEAQRKAAEGKTEQPSPAPAPQTPQP